MSRLWKAGSLRIRKAKKGLRFESSNDNTVDDYTSRLAKLLPADVIALYIFGESIIPENLIMVQLGLACICVIIVMLIRYNKTKEIGEDNPQWWNIIIAAISFMIWIYVTGDVFERLNLQTKWVGSLILAIWVVILPHIYKGDEIIDKK